jgi:hypothetical protein
VPAGDYHFILDAFIGGNVTVDFELLWRRGGTDTTVTSFSETYTKPANDEIPTAAEYDEQGTAIDYQPGDLLVLRYTTDVHSSPSAYTPNGDGSAAPGGAGRFPDITLPQ